MLFSTGKEGTSRELSAEALEFEANSGSTSREPLGTPRKFLERRRRICHLITCSRNQRELELLDCSTNFFARDRFI
jgi:hypothetical protein